MSQQVVNSNNVLQTKPKSLTSFAAVNQIAPIRIFGYECTCYLGWCYYHTGGGSKTK